ncbi:MAG: TRAP transporter small permease subunit, partial [Euzebyales bacterium]|nr:TRAP transporter small permease subunit [Euzebyales bacterium]
LALRPLLAYQRGMDRVSDGVGSVSKYLVLAVVVVGFGNALLRYIGRFTRTQLASNTYIELQSYLYATLFLLAFAYILKNGINVRVDFWFADRSDRTRAAIDFVGHLLGLLPFCVLGMLVVYPSVMTSWATNEGSPDPGGLPRAPLKSMLLVGLALLFLQGLAEMVKLVARLMGRSDLVVVAEESHAPPVRAE